MQSGREVDKNHSALLKVLLLTKVAQFYHLCDSWPLSIELRMEDTSLKIMDIANVLCFGSLS